MSEPKRSTEELLRCMSSNNKRLKIEKLETDNQGHFLLDPNNPYHVEWYFDDVSNVIIAQPEN